MGWTFLINSSSIWNRILRFESINLKEWNKNIEMILLFSIHGFYIRIKANTKIRANKLNYSHFLPNNFGLRSKINIKIRWGKLSNIHTHMIFRLKLYSNLNRYTNQYDLFWPFKSLKFYFHVSHPAPRATLPGWGSGARGYGSNFFIFR